MDKQQNNVSPGRRRVMLGLTGLVGFVVTGCSFGNNTGVSTSQGTSTTTSHATPPPTPKAALGTTLYVYQKHTRQIDDIAWSPDSTSIISVSNGIFSQVGSGTPTQVYMWNARTGDSNSTFNVEENNGGLAPLAWSPDGKMIALSGYPDAGGSSFIHICDAQTGTSTGACETQGVSSQLTWSPDSSFLASAGTNDIEIFNVGFQKKMLSYPASLAPGTFQPSNVVAWSPDGNTIVSAAAKDGHSLQFWNAYTGESLHYFLGPKPYVAAWSPDGKAIATGNPFAQSPQVLDSNTGQVLLNCQAKLPAFGASSLTYGLWQSPHTICWSPDSTHIAIATDQNQVQIWNVTTRNLAYTYTEHTGPVSAVAWSPDGSRIASASYDKTVRIWQAL